MRELFLLLDMDGVLVKDKALNPFPDTRAFIEGLRERGIPFRVVSNNSTKPPQRILEGLRDKGVVLKPDEFLSPLMVLTDYLKNLGVKRLFFIGMPAVREFLQEEGFEIREDHRVDAVVIGQDRNLDFGKLKLATSAVFLHEALIVPINLSRIVKDDDGLYFPGAGSVAFAIAHACNYKRELPNLGKPSKEFIALALKGHQGANAYLVSDDIYTDLMGARDLGLKTVFMTTGKYSAQELQRAGFEPDLTFNSLTELLQYLDKAVLS
ncbi:MAG: HAD-IIA family hydrolase [Aquificota bacterium]|nr:MAG: HAD-IIA family hydrolase [Aquificota bacterium]